MRIVVFILLCMTSLVGAREWSVDLILKQETFTQGEFSPDERALVWIKRTPDFSANRFRTDVFLTRTVGDSFETIQVTRSGKARDPRWSPDGRWIAFLSSRDLPSGKYHGKDQVWLLNTGGGEPFPLTQLENGVKSLAWLNPHTVVFTAREEKTFYERERKKQQDDARVVEDTTLFWPVRLFAVDIRTRAIRRLTTNRFQIKEFAPSPDGRWIVYSLQTSPITADARHQPRQFLLDVNTGTEREIFAEQYLDPSDFKWRSDSRGFYAWDEYSSDPWNEGAGIFLLFYYDIPRQAYETVPLHWKKGVGFAGFSVAGTGVHVQLADGPRYHARYYWKDHTGWHFTDVQDTRLRHATSVLTSRAGHRIVFVYSRPNVPPRYYWANYTNGKVTGARECISLNPFLQELPQPKAEVITWKGARGETVNGILYYPLHYKPGRRYPLMVVIHGGPSGVDLDAWRQDWVVYPALWAQKGAFVLRPNYHGSGNHGLDFVESIKGHYYELEVPDIVRGVRSLIAKGLVHPDSLGVMGWSNGAILTIALTVEKPTMFKAAAPGAGDVNWISDYGNCAFGVRFDNSYFHGPPWKYLDHYIEKSPLFRLERVVTPTLIFFGTKDTNVPTEQGWEHYRALQQIGKAPVRFLLFPGEPHGFKKPSHQRRKMEEELAWFDRYLFGRPRQAEENRLLASNAPLRWHRQFLSIARSQGAVGIRDHGILIPETVPVHDTLRVTRFEITRAQFAAFDSSYTYTPEEANLPVTGVDTRRIQAYIDWLNTRTRRNFRLPTRREFDLLLQDAPATGNTLSYWAGYTPNRDEYRQLQKIAAKYPATSFLKPVGQFPPRVLPNHQLVFDLNGNAAEWVVDNGHLKPAGLCALTSTDPRTGKPFPPPENLVGFRLVEIVSPATHPLRNRKENQ